MSEENKSNTTDDRDMEREIATCLHLTNDQVEKVKSAQSSGNTARFEDIAVRLNLATTKEVRRCLRNLGPAGFFRAHPNLVLYISQVVIALFTAASFVLHFVDVPDTRLMVRQSLTTTLTVQGVQFSDYERDLDNGQWKGTEILYDGAREAGTAGDKFVIIIANMGPNSTLDGCIQGTFMHRGVRKELRDYVHATKTTVTIGAGHGSAHPTDLNFVNYNTIVWNDDLAFDRDCDSSIDAEVVVTERHWPPDPDSGSADSNP